MTIEHTPLKDCYIIKPRVIEDSRGYFFEAYNKKSVQGTVLENYDWVQENESRSDQGVLRGLHFQKGEYSQAKLVRVLVGEVFDVAVDLRKDSPSFGKWHGVRLNDRTKTQFLVPSGFAHGFLVLSDFAIFSYRCDNYYAPEADSGIIFNDANLAIDWPVLKTPYRLSDKDKGLPTFEKCYKF
ncbi:MAG: dTDP-4-dehydrorhamnose 3,5-epimerase [Roseivirga sp.]|nr:dTDP-4-dehydrorhamnose 3,5-epimerase [Roseivirga sp.]